ncbi:non-canonical purine NTP diphosphatase [Aureivirga sp. CE67]|uniref:non-canonical purine NTP diphosphatase n=1 Tax=Aureivirga sp. CE67 TaxID=1788983 RepID=UPI0018C985AB|nr:non-canonical purine NTP diphosphatase [Aureivirga sp. CE67]
MNKTKIVFATNNAKKLEEVQAMLPESIEILSLKDISCFEDIPETSNTIEGNSILKADYVTEKYNYACFADDTGLEVESLNGEPGVYSARYAGEPADSEKNMDKLLQNLEGKENRKAHFKTVVCLNLNGEQHLFEGICNGTILEARKGEKGFGYDPIFQPKGFSQSFAEMTMDEKAKISHRGIAVRKLIEFLNNL